MNQLPSMHGKRTPGRWVLVFAAAGALSGCAAGVVTTSADREVRRLIAPADTVPASAPATSISDRSGGGYSFGSFDAVAADASASPRVRLAGYAPPAEDVKAADEKLAEEGAVETPTEKRLYMDCFMESIDAPGGQQTLGQWFRDNPLRLTTWGHIDQSFTWNVSSPTTTSPGGRFNGLRLFDDRSHDYRFNQLLIYVDRSLEPGKTHFDVGFRLTNLFGMDARFTHAAGLLSAETETYQYDPLEFYGVIRVPPIFEGQNPVFITFGKFVTPVGAEVIDASLNKLFSHSYNFQFAIPFTHLGLMARYPIFMDDDGTERLAATIGILQGWDVFTRDNDAPTGLLWANWTPNSEWSFNVVFLFGPETQGGRAGNNNDLRALLDIIIKYMPTERWEFALQGTIVHDAGGRTALGSPPFFSNQEAGWGGLVGYITYNWGPKNNVREVSSTLRLEWFNDTFGVRTGGFDGHFFAATLGLSWAPAFWCGDNSFYAPIVIRPEIRWDFFAGGGGLPTAPGIDRPFPWGSTNLSRHQVTVGGDIILKF
jgi:hypothetical protein